MHPVFPADGISLPDTPEVYLLANFDVHHVHVSGGLLRLETYRDPGVWKRIGRREVCVNVVVRRNTGPFSYCSASRKGEQTPMNFSGRGTTPLGPRN